MWPFKTPAPWQEFDRGYQAATILAGRMTNERREAELGREFRDPDDFDRGWAAGFRDCVAPSRINQPD